MLSLSRLLRLQYLNVNIRNHKTQCKHGEAASSSGKVAAGPKEEEEKEMGDDLLQHCWQHLMPVCSGEEELRIPAADNGDGAEAGEEAGAADDGDGAEAGEEAGAADDGEEAGGDVDHYAWIPPDPEDVVAGGELGECCKEAVAEEDPYQ